jgi:hypothetical protein
VSRSIPALAKSTTLFGDYRANDSSFVWERHHDSGWISERGPFGHGFRDFFQRSLTILRKRAICETHDNEIVALERLPSGAFVPKDGFTLSSVQGYHELLTDRDEVLTFEPTSVGVRRTRASRQEHD